MKTASWTFALTLAVSSAACDHAGKLRENLESHSLFQDSLAAARSSSCRRLLKPEHSYALPVPVMESGKGMLLVAFYRLADPQTEPKAAPFEYAAAFPPGRGADALCRVLSVRKDATPEPQVPPGIKAAAHVEAQIAYYSRIEDVASAYYSKRSLSAEQKLAAQELLVSFRTAAEPGLLADYYQLSPDYWEWLRRQTGDSLAKN